MSDDDSKYSENDGAGGVSRRRILRTSALAGIVGASVGLAGGLAIPRSEHTAGTSALPVGPETAGGVPKDYVPPGQLDDYYGIWSGGQSG